MDWKTVKRWNRNLHRDLGYFISALVITYSISGVALNHADVWNPDFILIKDTVLIPGDMGPLSANQSTVIKLSELVREKKYKVYDQPAPDQIKIYFDKSSFHVHLAGRFGLYEKIERRPLFYQVNLLHRNTIDRWKWISDIFAIVLITINLTGLFILKGKYGITGRGKWLLLAGLSIPVIALLCSM